MALEGERAAIYSYMRSYYYMEHCAEEERGEQWSFHHHHHHSTIDQVTFYPYPSLMKTPVLY